jgi:hypothetical protein
MHDESNTREAPDSPLGRLRSRLASTTAAKPVYVDIWPDGQLVARVGRPVDTQDTTAARSAMRTVGSLTADAAIADALNVTADDLADLIAASTVSLHERVDGNLAAINDASGLPLKFDANYGVAVGTPELGTARMAVLSVFTDGEPPMLDTMALYTCALQFAGVLATPGKRQDVEKAMGEASAQGS